MVIPDNWGPLFQNWILPPGFFGLLNLLIYRIFKSASFFIELDSFFRLTPIDSVLERDY